MSSKVLFIGLDGAEPDLVRLWSAQGLLPNIGRLLDAGFSAPVMTPRGFGDGVFWSTLFTGCNAGRHGHYFPWHFNSINYGLDTFNWEEHYQRDPFWLFASKMGRRVGVFDIYSSPLTQGIDGIQVQDWMTHDRTGEPRSWPQSIIGTLHEKVMEDPIGGNSEVESRTREEWVAFHRALISRIKAKTGALAGLLKNENWDLFAAGYSDAHDVGHQSWHWHDSSAPNHPAEWVQSDGDPLMQIYRELDQAIGMLVDAANADSIFIVPGLGMGMQTSCNAAFDQMLGHFSGFGGSRKELREQRSIRPWFEVLHNMNSGAVRLNLKGREANGLIEPEEYDSTCDSIVEQLMTVQDARTGLPVVEDVTRIRRDYHGPHCDRLPDMMVNWQRDFRVDSVRVPGLGEIRLEPVAFIESRSGDHTPNAMLITSHQYQVENTIHTEQIAPTLGRSMGLNFPGMDMSPLEIERTDSVAA